MWVTRLQGAELCAGIRARGGVARSFPVLSLVPPPRPPERLRERVAAADASVFVSRGAVEWGMRLIPEALQASLRALPCYCPGRETAGRLGQLGFRDVRAAPGNRGSEALLALPGLRRQRIEGRSVIIFRGVGGRALLGRELEARGARVEYIEVYTRTRRMPGRGELAALYAAGRPDCVEVSSRDGLESLHALLRAELGRVPVDLRVVVPAPRLLETCAALGFREPVLAEDATCEALLDGILTAVQRSGRGPSA